MTYWFRKLYGSWFFSKEIIMMIFTNQQSHGENIPFSSLLGGKSCSNMERSTGPRSALYVRPELFTCCKRLWYIQLFPKNFCTQFMRCKFAQNCSRAAKHYIIFISRVLKNSDSGLEIFETLSQIFPKERKWKVVIKIAVQM